MPQCLSDTRGRQIEKRQKLVHVLRYVEQGVANGTHSLIAFCDSCGGKNRNFKIATLMSYIVEKYPVHIFQLNFVQSGHSFLSNDEDFGVSKKPRKLQVTYIYIYIYLNIG